MRILIATDGSEYSTAAVTMACKLIKPENSEIRVISIFEDAVPLAADTVITSSEYYQIVEDALNERAEANVKAAKAELENQLAGPRVLVTTEVIRGFPDQVIIEEAKNWKADLIVVGSHGRGFWGRLLGSVSNGVVHHAPCSVLIVRKGSAI